MLNLDKIITFTLLVDILLRFFTAVKKEDEVIPVDDFNQNENRKRARMMLVRLESTSIDGLDDPKWERDISVICCKYIKNDAIADLLANIPITMYFVLTGFPDADE